MPPKKVLGEKRLTAEEKKRKEEKEKKEKEKERRERKAQLAADRTFGLKNKNVSAKVQARVEELRRDAPTKEAERARAEARAREKKKQKEAEEAAKRELEILMGVRSEVDRKVTDPEDGDDLTSEVGGMSLDGNEADGVQEESHKLTEEKRREILAQIELEKAREKAEEL